MHDTIQGYIVTLIGFIMALMMLFFGMEIWQQNNAQLTSNALVLQELNNNRDSSARSVHGVFAINKSDFEKSVRAANIPTWKQNKIDPNKDIFFKYTYDTSKQALEYVNSQDGHKHVTDKTYTPDKDNLVPIKSITVYVASRTQKANYTVKDKNGKTTTKQGPKIIDTITYNVSSVVKLRKDDATV